MGFSKMMKNLLRRNVVVSLLMILCLSTFCGFLIYNRYNKYTKAEASPVVSADFKMLGAGIMLVPNGEDGAIRFAVQCSADDYALIQNGATSGILILPSDFIEDGETLHTGFEKVVNEKTIKPKDKQINNFWEQDGDKYSAYVYMYNIPQGSYNRPLTAVAYIKVGEQYYYSDTIQRSIAYVASKALVAGESGVEECCTNIVDYVIGDDFAIDGTEINIDAWENFSIDLLNNKGLDAIISSSDSDVVSIDDNMFKAVSEGSATITAAIGSKKAQIAVNVNANIYSDFVTEDLSESEDIAKGKTDASYAYLNTETYGGYTQNLGLNIKANEYIQIAKPINFITESNMFTRMRFGEMAKEEYVGTTLNLLFSSISNADKRFVIRLYIGEDGFVYPSLVGGANIVNQSPDKNPTSEVGNTTGYINLITNVDGVNTNCQIDNSFSFTLNDIENYGDMYLTIFSDKDVKIAFDYFAKAKETITFDGMTLVEMSLNDDFDFNNGVVATNDKGENVSFIVDVSGVNFAVAGEYKAIYKAGDFTSERDVKVYGKPNVSTTSINLSYVEANDESFDYSSKITALDSFGQKLSVIKNGSYPKTPEGIIAAGDYTIGFKAVDKLGNETVSDVTVTVENLQKYNKADETIDLSHAILEINDVPIVENIYCEGYELSSNSYLSTQGKLSFLPEFFKGKEAKRYSILIVYNDGYTSFNIDIKDENPLAYSKGESINGNSYTQLDEIELPFAEKDEYTAQNFEIKHYLKTPGSSEREEIFESRYTLSEIGEYVFTIELIVDDVVSEAFVQNFTAESLSDLLKSNLINYDIISKNIFTEEKVDNKEIEFYDGETQKTVTANAIVLKNDSVPTGSGLTHYFSISKDYIEKAKILNFQKIKITLYTNCGFAIYDRNAETLSADLLSYTGASNNIIKSNITVDLSNVANQLAFDVFNNNANAEIVITEVKFLDENGEFTNINGNLAEEAILNYITGTNVTVTYEENVNLGGTLYNAIHIHGENTGSNGWTKSNFIDLQKLYALKGTHSKVAIKAYGNCLLGFFDGYSGGKGPIDCNGRFGTKVAALSDAIFMSVENGGTADLYIVDIRFADDLDLSGNLATEEYANYYITNYNSTTGYSDNAIVIFAENAQTSEWESQNYAGVLSATIISQAINAGYTKVKIEYTTTSRKIMVRDSYDDNGANMVFIYPSNNSVELVLSSYTNGMYFKLTAPTLGAVGDSSITITSIRFINE